MLSCSARARGKIGSRSDRLAREGMGASWRRWRRHGRMDSGFVRALMRVANTAAGVVGQIKRRDRDIVREEC